MRPVVFLREPLLLSLLLVSNGCALTSKADPVPMRYFSPPVKVGQGPQNVEPDAPPSLRIARLTVAEHLTENLAYRPNPTEVAYYETLRWTETPDVYLNRALSEELFANSGFQRAVVEGQFALDVQLVAFEELKFGAPRVRVALYLAIADRSIVLRERWVEVEKPLSASDDAEEHPQRVALALAEALREASLEVRQELKSLAEAVRVAEPEPPAITPETHDARVNLTR